MKNQTYSIRPLICVCALSSMLMAAQALSPGLQALQTLYGIDEAASSLLVTLPYLISIPFSLIAGRLSNYISKKTISVYSGFLIAIAGILPFFIPNSFTATLIIRSFMGIGLGALFTIAPSLAPDYYPNGTLRNITIGMQSAWAGSGGFVFNILSGYLVKSSPKNIYLVYILCVLFTALVFFLLPKQPPIRSDNLKSSFKPQGTILLICIMTILFLAAGMTLALNASSLIIEKNLGSSIEAGFATSCYSIAAFCTGLLYAVISKFIFGKRSVYVACLLSLIGSLMCALSTSLIVIYGGASLLGISLSLFMPSCISFIISSTPPENTSINIAIMMVGSASGQTFSSYIINPVSTIIGPSVSYRFYGAGIVFIFVIILAIFLRSNSTPTNSGKN